MEKIKIATVFGTSKSGRKFYVSDKETWENERCCGDSLDTDVYNAVYETGLVEEQEGIWAKQDSKENTVNIIVKLQESGFEYNEDFEKFMR